MVRALLIREAGLLRRAARRPRPAAHLHGGLQPQLTASCAFVPASCRQPGEFAFRYGELRARARRVARSGSGPAVARTQLVGHPVEPPLVQHRALAPDLVLADLDDPVQPDVRRPSLPVPRARSRCRPSSGRRRARTGSTASARRGRGPHARRRAPAGPCRGRRPPRRAPRSRRSRPGRRRRRGRARRRRGGRGRRAGAVRAPPVDGRGRAARSVRARPCRVAGRWRPLPLLRRLRQQLEPGLRRLPQQAPPRRHARQHARRHSAPAFAHPAPVPARRGGAGRALRRQARARGSARRRPAPRCRRSRPGSWSAAAGGRPPRWRRSAGRAGADAGCGRRCGRARRARRRAWPPRPRKARPRSSREHPAQRSSRAARSPAPMP